MSALFGRSWSIWELRSPVFPLTFVYPAQALAARLGVSTIHGLVVAGRAVVAVLSSATILVVYGALKRTKGREVAILAAALLAVSGLSMAFGSSELPRPVSTLFVVSSYALLFRRQARPWMPAVAGVTLALASQLRFSEAIFLAPAVACLIVTKRISQVFVLVSAFSVTFAITAGVSDWLYWNRPYSSLRAIVDYTLIQRHSSRGFQPPWHYFLFLAAWTNWIVFALAAVAVLRRLDDVTTLWLVVPLGILSLLPHKEPRYVIPVIPFLAILASQGACALFRPTAGDASASVRAAVPIALAFAVVLELPGWRLNRDNGALLLTSHLAQQPPGTLAAEQLWRLGGRLYLAEGRGVVDLDVPREDPPAFVQRLSGCRWVALRSRTLDSRGYGPSLLAGGWREVPFPEQQASGYRLFER